MRLVRDHVADPAARVGDVAAVARDQVDVGVHHRLPGEDAAVHPDVEAIRPVAQLQNFLGFPDKIETRGVLLIAEVPDRLRMAPRDDEDMPRRDGVGVVDGLGQGVLDDQLLAPGVAEDAVLGCQFEIPPWTDGKAFRYPRLS